MPDTRDGSDPRHPFVPRATEEGIRASSCTTSLPGDPERRRTRRAFIEGDDHEDDSVSGREPRWPGHRVGASTPFLSPSGEGSGGRLEPDSGRIEAGHSGQSISMTVHPHFRPRFGDHHSFCKSLWKRHLHRPRIRRRSRSREPFRKLKWPLERWRFMAVFSRLVPVGRLSLSLTRRPALPTPQGDRYDRRFRLVVVPFLDGSIQSSNSDADPYT